MRSRVSLLAFAILLVVAASASAQYRGGTVELNGFAGYLFGGDFGHTSDFGPSGRVDIDDHLYYGGRVGYNFTSLWEVEFEYAQDPTHLSLHPFRGNGNLPDVGIGDVKFEYFMANMTLNFGHGRWVPYFTIGSGAAHIVPTVPNTFSSSTVRYTTSIGGGVKWFVDPHFAFRFDGRVYSTFLDNARVVCGPNFCTSTNWVSNGGFNGGIIIAF